MDKNIIEEYLPLVKSIAGKYSYTHIPFEDLVQEGTIGLWEAWKRFDPDRDVKFSTYATYWIKKQILGLLDNEKKNSLDATEYNDEVNMPSSINVTGIKMPSEITLPESLPVLEKKVITLLYGLDGTGSYDLAEIGVKLDLPRERIRQIKEKALRRLRKKGIKLSP